MSNALMRPVDPKHHLADALETQNA
jgi:hypothetical protein